MFNYFTGFIVLIFTLFSATLFAQEYFVVEDVIIRGNNRTKSYIVNKELDFEIGDTIYLTNLFKRLESNKNNLQNTGLFTQVVINTTNWRPEEKKSNIQINLIENWFWYPVPVLEFGDRSLNEWYYEHNASIKRLNLGIRFLHINLTGNNDFFKLIYHTGFTQKLELDYTLPYLSKNSTVGAYINMMYVTHKDLAYETKYNKLQFYNFGENILLNRFRASIGLKFRSNQKFYHSLLMEYYQNTIHDTISNKLNPNYFNPGENSLKHFSLNYHFLYNNVNLNIYPTSGSRFSLDLQKDGLGLGDINLLQLTAGYEHIFELHSNYSISTNLKLKKSFFRADEIPYIYHIGLGYEDDVLSGYQLYVIDGINYTYLKTTQKLKILDNNYDFKNYMPVKQLKLLPLRLYISLHADLAYVENRQFYDSNPFTNRLIYGLGLSLDLVAYYNYVFSLEFSVNHTGETGIFFQGVNTFE